MKYLCGRRELEETIADKNIRINMSEQLVPTCLLDCLVVTAVWSAKSLAIHGQSPRASEEQSRQLVVTTWLAAMTRYWPVLLYCFTRFNTMIFANSNEEVMKFVWQGDLRCKFMLAGSHAAAKETARESRARLNLGGLGRFVRNVLLS